MSNRHTLVQIILLGYFFIFFNPSMASTTHKACSPINCQCPCDEKQRVTLKGGQGFDCYHYDNLIRCTYFCNMQVAC